MSSTGLMALSLFMTSATEHHLPLQKHCSTGSESLT
ncbi:hypothetical protein RLOC_00013906 [Lonchura striata]|uniref:Uncharacterized protein n=1 Tax=Lonchura striata TaxID=40157 RepID=A0A218V8W5_9PASE|nr:hypothetical protein RLOC_00013906 [Lonchura striata domestica]